MKFRKSTVYYTKTNTYFALQAEMPWSYEILRLLSDERHGR